MHRRSSQSKIMPKIKSKLKRCSKSVGKAHCKTNRRAKSRLGKRKKIKRQISIYDQMCQKAAIIIQKHWRNHLLLKLTKNHAKKSMETTTQSRQKLRHSFSFGLDAKCNDTSEKSSYVPQHKYISDGYYKNEILMYDLPLQFNKESTNNSKPISPDPLELLTDIKTDIANITNDHLSNSSSNTPKHYTRSSGGSSLISPATQKNCQSESYHSKTNSSKSNTQNNSSNKEILIISKHSEDDHKSIRKSISEESKISSERLEFTPPQKVIKKRNSSPFSPLKITLEPQCDFEFINQVKYDFEAAKSSMISKSLEYDKLATVVANKSQLIISDADSNDETSYLINTPESLDLNLDSNNSLQHITEKIHANQVILDDLKFDLKSESDENQSKKEAYEETISNQNEFMKTSELMNLFSIDVTEESQNNKFQDEKILEDDYESYDEPIVSVLDLDKARARQTLNQHNMLKPIDIDRGLEQIQEECQIKIDKCNIYNIERPTPKSPVWKRNF